MQTKIIIKKAILASINVMAFLLTFYCLIIIKLTKVLLRFVQRNTTIRLMISYKKEIAQKSLKDYISQPKTPYSIHFAFNVASAQRDISAERYINYESMRVLFS